MDTVLLDGRMLSKKEEEKVRESVSKLGETPKLAIVMVGENKPSEYYVNSIIKKADKLGINAELFKFEELITEEEIISEIDFLSKSVTIDGIIIQLPLPRHMDEKKVLSHIDPSKDVDCISPKNVGEMVLSYKNAVYPCTPSGVIKLIDFYDIELEGKEVVVVGRSNIVGKPLANIFINRGATVTVTNSKTEDLSFHTKRADVLCVAVGKAEFINSSMIKEGCIVIDVGINSVDGELKGDVSSDVIGKASHYTPVPGGTGPMTIVSLMDNVIKLIENRRK